MPFLVGCLALGTPRFAILLVVLFSDYIGRAYDTTLWPLLGFFFMPLTTLSYAFAINSNGAVDGMYLVLVVVTVLLDLGLGGRGLEDQVEGLRCVLRNGAGDEQCSASGSSVRGTWRIPGTSVTGICFPAASNRPAYRSA